MNIDIKRSVNKKHQHRN